MLPVARIILPSFSLVISSTLLGAGDTTMQLQSDSLDVQISARGAELQSIRNRTDGFEYLWQNGSGAWKGPAPLLFPVIGGLHGKAIRHHGRTHPMPFHGFARDEVFPVESVSSEMLTLALSDDANLRKMYPFPFRLAVTYRLSGRELAVTAEITNTGSEPLPFAIGFHPGFNIALPTTSGTVPARLEIASEKPLVRLLKNPANGFLSGARELWSDEPRTLDLTGDFPGPDAIVLQTQAPVRATITDEASGHRIVLKTDSPFFGIWRKPIPQAPFICLEPWWGTTDPDTPYGDFPAKPNLQFVAPGESLTTGFELEFHASSPQAER